MCDKLTYINTYIHAYRQTDRHTYIHTYIRTYVRKYIHTYIHTYIQTDRQTYRQTHTHTYIPTYLHRHLSHITYVCVTTHSTHLIYKRRTNSQEKPQSNTHTRTHSNTRASTRTYTIFHTYYAMLVVFLVSGSNKVEAYSAMNVGEMVRQFTKFRKLRHRRKLIGTYNVCDPPFILIPPLFPVSREGTCVEYLYECV